jgi:uncharacterized protein (DUF1800 family)
VLGGAAGSAAVLGAESLLSGVALAGPRSNRAAPHRPDDLPQEGHHASSRRVTLESLIDPDPDVHVARRLTYGATPATVAAVRRLGAAEWVNRQLDPSAIPDRRCETYLERYPLVGLGPAALAREVPGGSFEQMSQMQSAALVRATWSTRQLYELMCEFWWNHFNVGIPNADVWNLCGQHETTIRAHALGKFSELLSAVAHSPATLVALNQTVSVGSNPNENYARELLELHTVGVGAGYRQEDVHEAALLLTGLGLGSDGYSFAYTPSNHYVGRVTVMGFSDENPSAAGGLGMIERYLSYLAHHPATATHLATELATRFVSDTPPESLVSRLAATYTANDTAMVPVLQELFSSSEFFASVGAKTRRPIEQIAASLRILDYTLANDGLSDLADLSFCLEIMGQAPMGWPQPNGYPDVAASWKSASAAQTAWGCHVRLTGGWWTETLAFPGVLSLIGNPAPTSSSGDVLDALCERLLFQRISAEDRATVLGFMGFSGSEPIGPEGLLNIPIVAKVLLDSAYFAVR